MPRYVALFRGINVGKAKRIAMADLRRLLEKLGYRDVKTLLNSGNAAVAKQLGVDARVIVKSAQDVGGLIADNKFEKLASDHSRLLVAVTDEDSTLAGLKALAAKDWGREKVHVGKHGALIWCANGILESQALTAVLKGLEGAGTTRNWATLNKIHVLLQTDGS
jgi:uncharacterized protein (DUF1697 family)